MRYEVRDTEGSSNFKDKRGRTWPLLTRKEYRKIPPGERRICAEYRSDDSGSANLIMEYVNGDETFTAGLYPYRYKLKWHEKVTGYIPVTGEDGRACCVRVIGRSALRICIVPILIAVLIALAHTGRRLYVELTKEPVLDEAAIGYSQEGLVNDDPDKIMIPVIGDIETEEGERHVDDILPNPEGNTCYFRYILELEDTGEVLFESDLIEPGKALIGFYMDRGLEEGEYDAIIRIRTYDEKDYERELNGDERKINIEVR